MGEQDIGRVPTSAKAVLRVRLTFASADDAVTLGFLHATDADLPHFYGKVSSMCCHLCYSWLPFVLGGGDSCNRMSRVPADLKYARRLAAICAGINISALLHELRKRREDHPGPLRVLTVHIPPLGVTR